MTRRLVFYGLSLSLAAVFFLGGDCDNVIPEPPDEGTYWRFSEPPVGAVFYSIDGLDRHEVWLVGEKPNGNGVALLFDGISWKLRLPPTGTNGLFAVDAQDYNNIWAAGEDEYFYRYDGANWSRWDSPASGIYSIDFGRVDFGFAVGADGLIMEFDGNSWETVESPVTDDLKGIEFVNESEAWAVGFAGTVLHYSQGSWEIIDAGTTADLYGLRFISANEGWISGSDGTILNYNNGVFSAQATPFPEMTYRTIGMADGNSGWAGGADRRIIGYDGENWSSASGLPSGIWSIYGIDVRAQDEAWAVGEFGTGGLILHYR